MDKRNQRNKYPRTAKVSSKSPKLINTWTNSKNNKSTDKNKMMKLDHSMWAEMIRISTIAPWPNNREKDTLPTAISTKDTVNLPLKNNNRKNLCGKNCPNYSSAFFWSSFFWWSGPMQPSKGQLKTHQKNLSCKHILMFSGKWATKAPSKNRRVYNPSSDAER